MRILISNFLTFRNPVAKFVCLLHGREQSRMDPIIKIQDSIHLESLGETLGLVSQSAKEALKAKTGVWISDYKRLKQRSHEFAVLQELIKTKGLSLDAQFQELKELEPEIEALTAQASDLETEAFNELLFLKPWSTPFNFLPFLLAIWATIRVYVFPGLAILMPVMMLILPFLLVRFIFHVPLTVSRYFHMIGAMFTGQIESLFNPNAVTSQQPFKFDIFALAKHGIIIATVVQSFLQPYWSFQHLSAIDQIIQKKADTLIRFQELYATIKDTLSAHGFTLSKNPFASEITDSRQFVAEAQLHPTFLKLALRNLGALEVLMRAAQRSDLVPVVFSEQEEPLFRLTGAYDYRIGEGRIPFDIDLGQPNRHALLTGPNRGGKSTTLRAILTSCALAHTYGFAFAKEATMTPFQHLYVCLTPEDLPGKKSRFEREIEFTATTLKARGKSMVLLDELYHSTNPPDATRACALYTEQLWVRPNTLSIISTHLFDFVESAPSTIQRLCCPATEKGDGSIEYTYRLSQGICRVSSVQELLVENGLVKQDVIKGGV